MKSIQIGSAVRAPSSASPSGRSWSKPTHTVATRFGVKPLNQVSFGFVGRAGLAGDVAAVERQRAPRRCRA